MIEACLQTLGHDGTTMALHTAHFLAQESDRFPERETNREVRRGLVREQAEQLVFRPLHLVSHEIGGHLAAWIDEIGQEFLRTSRLHRDQVGTQGMAFLAHAVAGGATL